MMHNNLIVSTTTWIVLELPSSVDLNIDYMLFVPQSLSRCCSLPYFTYDVPSIADRSGLVSWRFVESESSPPMGWQMSCRNYIITV